MRLSFLPLPFLDSTAPLPPATPTILGNKKSKRQLPPKQKSSAKKLTVRTELCQPDCVGIWLSVDQQKVWFDVAFPVAGPIAA